MSGIMPPPFFQKPARWDDCNCANAQDRFYEQFGYEAYYDLRRSWKALRERMRRLRALGVRWRCRRPGAAPAESRSI